MYNTKKLRTPFTGVIRRALPSSSRLSLHTKYWQIHFSAVFSPSSPADCPRAFANYTLSFLLNLDFHSRTFFSESTKKVDSTKSCRNCDAAAGTWAFLLCDSCRSIQPVDFSVDYFHIFGLERKHDIEVDSLEGKYKGWQKKLHPDPVHSKTEIERAYAAEQSPWVIDAYCTLTKPSSRAIYIVSLSFKYGICGARE
ncbi:hypothetical protein SLE2022_140020 [Rubroshorea leprosula]